MSETDRNPTETDAGLQEKRSHARTPRTIRFSDPEWELVENTARRRGIAAAEFIRNAALATTGDKSTAIPPGISAQIERIYRGVYLLSTLKRDEMVREGRQDELDRTMKAARDSQVSFLDDAPK